MTEEKQFTENQSLKLINRMIYEAKSYYFERGLAGLIYGFSVFAVSILSYMRDENIIVFPFHPFNMVIPIFFVLGWLQWKEEKKKKAKTFTDEAIDFAWTGFMLSAIVAFAAGFAGLYYISITIVLILMAFATFITGMLTKFRHHIVCGFISWLLAIFSFFLLNPTIYLLLAANAILLWVIPGFILHTTFKKLHHDR